MAPVPDQQHKNAIFSLEKGEIVKRTHNTVYHDVKCACAALESWGVKAGMRVGLCASNCYHWIVYDLALIELRAISVAFIDDLEHVNVDDLFDRYSLSLLLVSAAKASRISKNASAIARIDAENKGIKAIDRGRTPVDRNFDSPGLVFSLEPSGQLKGLILDRRGIEASVEALTEAVSPQYDDCLLLFLPFSDFQQRLLYYWALWCGFNLIVTGPAGLFRLLKDLRPTILIAPSKFYEAFERDFCSLPKWKRLAGTIAHKLRRLAIGKKLAKIIFKNAYETLGGRVRFMTSDMTPIKRSTRALFELMQLPLFEGYGVPEFGTIALNLPGASKQDSVGRPLPGIRVEIAGDGEIIAAQAHNIAFGYFECPEGKAEETFLGNQCIATGDLGHLDEDGYLHLIGRKPPKIVAAERHSMSLKPKVNA